MIRTILLGLPVVAVMVAVVVGWVTLCAWLPETWGTVLFSVPFLLLPSYCFGLLVEDYQKHRK